MTASVSVLPTTGAPPTVRVAREDGFDFLDPGYADLHARSTATLFQHPVWLHHLYADLAPAVGARPVVVTVRTATDGRLVGVLPMVRRGRFARRLEPADLGVSDYAAPVLDAELAPALLRDPALLQRIRGALGRADLVRFDKIRGDAGDVAALLGARRVVRHQYDAHAIPLGDSVEDWRADLDPGLLRHLARKRKRLGSNKRVVDVREVTDPAEIDEAFDRMREFRRARFAERRAVDLMQDPSYDAFYRSVARRGAVGDGPGRTWVLTVDDEIIGVSFDLTDADRDLFLLIGYDYERYRNYSLGLLLVEDLVGVSIMQGRREHDLTIGHDTYKSDFGAVLTPMYSARRAVTPRGWVAQVAADQNAAARRVAKRALAYRDRHDLTLRRLLPSRSSEPG